MYYDYGLGLDESGTVGILVFYLIYYLVAGGLGIASYVLRSLGTYTIAKRRGLNHPWMAWVPVLDYWLLGSISDQYQYVVNGKNKNKRKWMVGLYGAMWVVLIGIYIVMFVMMANAISGAFGNASEAEMLESMLGSLIGMLLLFLPLLGLSIAVSVIRYIALYDLYKSCDPNNSVMFLVLSIFISVTEPFFIFFARKKDKGMPPRRPQPTQPSGYIPEQPVYRPAEPVYEPQPPVYQEAAPMEEPIPVAEPLDTDTPAEPAADAVPWDAE